MDVIVAAQTDVGRARNNNEDSHYADADLGLFVVCDGMGGHNAGEVASRTACDVLLREITGLARARERFLATGSLDDAETLRSSVGAAVGTANREIHRQASRQSELAGMGTTCTLVLLCGHGKGVLAHVGDSRLYLRRAGRVHQLTQDHTYVDELVRRGSLTPREARDHPHGNVLSRALGVQSTVGVESVLFDVDPDDTFLLCSDGLHNYFEDKDELGGGLGDPDLAGGLDRLVQTALDRGGHDNITGVAFRIGAQGRDAALNTGHRAALLQRVPLFSRLTYNELVRVIGLTQIGRAAAGQVVVRAGEPGRELYVTLGGEVEVQAGGDPPGRLGAGAYFGTAALFEDLPAAVTVRACTEVTLLAMRRVDFAGLLQREPILAAKLLSNFLTTLRSGDRPQATAAAGPEREVSDLDFEIIFDEEDEGER